MKEEGFSIAMLSVDVGNILRNDEARHLTLYTNTMHELFILRNEFIKHQCIRSVKIPHITYDPHLIYRGVIGTLKRNRLLFSELDIKALTKDVYNNKLFNYYYGNSAVRYFIFMDIEYSSSNIEEVSNVISEVLTNKGFKLVRRRLFSELLDKEKLLKMMKNEEEIDKKTSFF